MRTKAPQDHVNSTARNKKPKTKVQPTPTLQSQLLKAPTGIQGLDDITGGGVPQGHPTLICGGAAQFNEPGDVCIRLFAEKRFAFSA